jgi:hypothetical protein
MKKLLLIPLVLSGCVRVGYDIENIKPNEVGIDDSFTNRIFDISCRGNGYASSKEVDKQCREYASQFAFKRGYMHFSVLDQDAGSDTTTQSYTTTTPVTTYSNATAYSGGYSAYGHGTSTTYVPQTHHYNVTIHRKSYVFVLIEENELEKWKNYYKVSDYYPPRKN